jgi:hypothetical protein
MMTYYLPSVYPTNSVQLEPFSFTTSWPVAAGSNSVVVSGVISGPTGDWGDCGAVVQGCPWITFQFHPDTLP